MAEKTEEQKAAEAAAAAEKKVAAPKLVEGRVLLDTAEHQVDAVITLPEKDARAAEKAGWLDTNAEAVAFAKGLAAGA